MANEIAVSVSLSVNHSPMSAASKSISGSFDQAGINYFEGSQTIPTTAGGTALTKGGVGTIGWVWIKNTDSTHFVQIMTAVAGTAFMKLKPGQAFEGPLDPGIAAPAALADTASVNIEMLILEA